MKRGKHGLLTAARQAIVVQGAREHNLKNLTVVIPRGRFVVITGVSGSGKSTLAFDILFAEGQRRFLDALNAYARQFVEQLPRPDVDRILGLPPTVSIEQRTSRGGGKSTVATVTEIHHFLRLLYARLGIVHCPDCNHPVTPQTRLRLVEQLRRESANRGKLALLAPVVRHRKGFHTEVARWAAQRGFRELRVDGRIYPVEAFPLLDRYREHEIEIVVAWLEPGMASKQDRLVAWVSTALEMGQGFLYALDQTGQVTVHSTERACPRCGRSLPPLDPKHFSFNSPLGWCPRCRGFGELFYLPDSDRGADAEEIEETWWSWADEREPCPECSGTRLNPVARAVRLPLSGVPAGLPHQPTIVELGRMSVDQADRLFHSLRFSGLAARIARDILPEIRVRLRFLQEVGLGYLHLDRSVPSLSGGEAQRIRLAAQLGSNLSGVLYVLDEPTIGLHPRDNERLLQCLKRLCARGNSVVVVEHDEQTMREADWILDLGPGAGIHGGQIVAEGPLQIVRQHPTSLTARHLRFQPRYPRRGTRRPVPWPPELSDNPPPDQPAWLCLERARKHNLQDLTVWIPLQRLVVVTGVSGSGKSTLVHDCLLPALQHALAERRSRLSASDPSPQSTTDQPSVHGHQNLRGVYEVDQSPIGRTPRSIPATYVGFFDDIRALFAATPEARMRGFGPGRFSFNSPQGRCPECAGAGEIRLEMSFLPTAFVKCNTCNGTRFNPQTLEVHYAGKNIAQVLDLSVEEALAMFHAVPSIRRALEALRDIGLGYLKLGQTSPTLSGGEAQRVKLVAHLLAGMPTSTRSNRRELTRRVPGHLFILEEPTIGLHAADVEQLVEVLQRLVDTGHSVLVIEHHPGLIAEADWVIDLGPEGGEDGGRLVVCGPPETVAACPQSHTGRFLRPLLRHSASTKTR
ncbi:MAG: excinuclease ABC subunit A [Limisphaera sp.]|nr:excinuclease ABC subunit A [Limisphaera sp.]